jgi:hypothetical protein
MSSNQRSLVKAPAVALLVFVTAAAFSAYFKPGF